MSEIAQTFYRLRDEVGVASIDIWSWNQSKELFVHLDMDADVAEKHQDLKPTDFATFYRRAWSDIYRPLVVTLRDPDLAQEAVDEAMARAFSRWSKIRNASNPEGWVYRVAYRWAVDRLRRRSTERRLLPRLTSTDTGEIPTPEPMLDGALASLPLGQRSVVILSCGFDWSESEIAEALGIRPGTVKSRLHRGLQALRKELDS